MVWTTLRVVLLLGLLSLPVLAPARPAHADMSLAITDVVWRVNQIRAEAGLAPLEERGELDEVAFERSADMAARGYFSHTTPDGQTVFSILQARGVPFNVAGENLAWNTAGPGRSGAVAVQGFVDSPPHRANLLDPAFSQVGIGIASDGSRTIFTLVFLG